MNTALLIGSLASLVPLGSDPVVRKIGSGYQAFGFPVIVRDQVILEVEEQFQNADLNGDGDTQDRILLWHDFETEQTFNTGIEGRFVFDGETLAVTVSELKEGADVNGDGDAHDGVLFLARSEWGRAVNTRLQVSSMTSMSLQPNHLFVGIREGVADLNDDGDLADEVVVAVNLTTFDHQVVDLPYAEAFQYEAAGSSVAFRIFETTVGTDLNGDGDTLDNVLHVWDARSETSLNTGLSVQGGFFEEHFEMEGRYLACTISEDAQGRDLNDDGDADDEIPFVHLLAEGTTWNLARALRSSVSMTTDQVGEGRVTFRVSEESQGGSDLNGDGDALDFVAHVFDTRSGTTANLGVAVANGVGPDNFLRPVGDRIGVMISEAQQGQDLDGDGDQADRVLSILGAEEGTAIDQAVEPDAVGIQLLLNVASEGSFVGYVVDERVQDVDLDGNGTADDKILHTFDELTSTTVNVGVPTNEFFSVSSERIVFRRLESLEGVDFNGDGDAVDPVWFFVER